VSGACLPRRQLIEDPVAHPMQPRRQAWRKVERHFEENTEEEAFECKEKDIRVSHTILRYVPQFVEGIEKW
jgi:hypothetical protein